VSLGCWCSTDLTSLSFSFFVLLRRFAMSERKRKNFHRHSHRILKEKKAKPGPATVLVRIVGVFEAAKNFVFALFHRFLDFFLFFRKEANFTNFDNEVLFGHFSDEIKEKRKRKLTEKENQ
jgi:hypothetical protein